MRKQSLDKGITSHLLASSILEGFESSLGAPELKRTTSALEATTHLSSRHQIHTKAGSVLGMLPESSA
jgi:hypothetical protein